MAETQKTRSLKDANYSNGKQKGKDDGGKDDDDEVDDKDDDEDDDQDHESTRSVRTRRASGRKDQISIKGKEIDNRRLESR